MIIDARNGEQYEGIHYLYGGAFVRVWGGGSELAFTVPSIPGVEYRLSVDRLHFRYENNRDAQYRYGSDRLHYRLKEE